MQLSTLLLALALLATASAARSARPKWSDVTSDYSFEDYAAAFAKTYATADERAARGALFAASLKRVVEHNAVEGSTWKAGLNHLSDATDEEYRALSKGRNARAARDAPAPKHLEHAYDGSALPENVDWRTCVPGAAVADGCPLAKAPEVPIVTAVKNQGQCGSCWAFASTEVLESHFAIYAGWHYDLAPQHFVSCAPNDDDCGGTGGCEGSTADVAYAWLAEQGGLATSFVYGYSSGLAGETGACDEDRTAPVVAIDATLGKPTSNNYTALMSAVANVGPVAVNVDATNWRDYESGVYDGCGYTGNIDIDHVVALEGYGTDPDTLVDYWLIRNSWSPSFGEHGYIRLLRESTEVCGSDSTPADGWDCEPFPDKVQVCGQCGVAYEPTYPTGVGLA